MALNRGKYHIEVRNYDAINSNQIFSDFMQQTLNFLDGLYFCEECLLIDTIMKDQLRIQNTAEIEN